MFRVYQHPLFWEGYAVVSIVAVITGILLFNLWGSNPIFVVGSSVSVIHGEYFKNTLTNYEEHFHGSYLYGIYGIFFLIKGLSFIPYKIYQIVNTVFVVGAAFLILRLKCPRIGFPLVAAAMVSSTIITGPRFETLTITLLLLVAWLLGRVSQLSWLHILFIAIVFGMLPNLHPMSALQGGLLLLWYLTEKTKAENLKILLAGALSFIFFFIFIKFDIDNYLNFYTKGGGFRDLERHHWRPFLALDFLAQHPLILLLMGLSAFLQPFRKQIVFLGLSMLVGIWFGRAYYCMYSMVFLIISMPADADVQHFLEKRVVAWVTSLVLVYNFGCLMIPFAQAVEQPGYYKALNKMLQSTQSVCKVRYPDMHNRQLWAGVMLTPGLYDIPNLRFYWALTPLLNGYGYMRPGDIVVCVREQEYNMSSQMADKQSLELKELPVEHIYSKGILTPKLKRTAPIQLRIFEVAVKPDYEPAG